MEGWVIIIGQGKTFKILTVLHEGADLGLFEGLGVLVLTLGVGSIQEWLTQDATVQPRGGKLLWGMFNL